MSYEAELNFLIEAFEKCHLQTRLVDLRESVNTKPSVGLYMILEREISDAAWNSLLTKVQSNTIYKVADSFLCNYQLLRLPDKEQQRILLIGPYCSRELSEQQIMELAEQFGILPRQMRALRNFYSGVPILAEESPLFALLDVFAEKIWGGSEKFSVENVEQEQLGAVSPISVSAEKGSECPEQALWNMQTMERRYAQENELLQAVEEGQTHKAERILAAFSVMSFEKRLADTLRNMKNYCIIMNTLLRKAAENGGVHPVYLDSVSSDFAKKIELLNSVSDVQGLMGEMTNSYCRLVKKHSIRHYSPPIQKAITYIDSDLTADLSLRALAAIQNVSAGYLSALFKQETGQTITDYVNQKRIKQAMRLLKTTKLQVQTIAQHCGILDVHYFSKLFKKQVGKTPKEYRESH